MNIVLTVAQIVAPVFLLASVGVVWVRLGYDYRIEFVTRLTMTLGVPALVFTSLMRSEVAPDALAAMAVAALAAYGGIAAPTLLLVRFLRLDLRTFLMPLVFGNTGNIGLPVALFAFGAAGLDHAVVVLAVTSLLSFTIGLWVVAGGGSLLRAVREPVVAATLLGALFLWRGWTTPEFVTNTLALLGQTAIPLMLITLGVAVARLPMGRLARPALLSLAKAALCIGVAWGVGRALGLPPVAFGVLVLQMAAPVAVTSYLLAARFDADADAVAGLVCVSTLLSVALIPALLAVLL